MPSIEALLVFSALAVGLAVTPGPNMIYLVSRALAQGTRAGMISLAGCALGSAAIMLCAAAGITAALVAVPYAWDALRIGGAAYLAWLAWQCLKPGAEPIFAPRSLPRESNGKLFAVGFATAALNPKVALFYMAVLPPFIDASAGNVLVQGAVLGGLQVAIGVVFDALLVYGAAGAARFLATRPAWLAAQRYVLGVALALIAAKLAFGDSFRGVRG
ncbi:LysE family translocator [Roseococcus pinisoli]|uniref:LysE family translocator n=1 Tax=Roseococcus pinisoli TaxID=2835040 RepID=A0ABS5QDF6_9PROT|nr:LysE family translocator [Roseococcus pinisoli]MBS7810967.1 LysE family translocator [Roseococcus pinisoli]